MNIYDYSVLDNKGNMISLSEYRDIGGKYY